MTGEYLEPIGHAALAWAPSAAELAGLQAAHIAPVNAEACIAFTRKLAEWADAEDVIARKAGEMALAALAVPYRGGE